MTAPNRGRVVPARTPPAAPADRGDAPAGRRDPAAPGRSRAADVRREALREPQPIPSMPGVVQHTRDSLKAAADAAVGAGVGGLMVFGVPARRDASGPGDGRARHPQRGTGRSGGRGRRRHRADGRPVPGRVHRPRALRGAGRGRHGGQRCHAACATRRWHWPRPTPGADLLGTSGMMDGQVGAVRVGAGLRRALIDTGDVRVRSEVRVGVLRPVPRGGRLGAARRPAQLPAGPGQPARGAREVALDVAEGADLVMVKPALGYLDMRRRHRCGVDGPGCGIPGLGRVLDGGGCRGPRLDRPGPGDPGDAHRHPPRRRADRTDLLGCRGRRPPGARGGVKR